MTKDEFKILLALFMVSDPWPLDEIDYNIMLDFLENESRSMGYDGWIDAYHELT